MFKNIFHRMTPEELAEKNKAIHERKRIEDRKRNLKWIREEIEKKVEERWEGNFLQFTLTGRFYYIDEIEEAIKLCTTDKWHIEHGRSGNEWIIYVYDKDKK